MNIASIIFLIALFGGFITVVILVYKKRKKLRDKMDTNPHLYEDVFMPDDLSSDHGAGGDGVADGID